MLLEFKVIIINSVLVYFWVLFWGGGGRFDSLLFANVGQGLNKRYEKDFKQHDSWDRSAGLKESSKNRRTEDGKSTSRRDSESQKVPALIQKSAGTPEHCLRRLWQKAHLR